MAIPVSWIYDKLRIPVPDGNEGGIYRLGATGGGANGAISNPHKPASSITDALDAVETAFRRPGIERPVPPTRYLAPVDSRYP